MTFESFSSVCIALRVPPAETRLMVYRRFETILPPRRVIRMSAPDPQGFRLPKIGEKENLLFFEKHILIFFEANTKTFGMKGHSTSPPCGNLVDGLPHSLYTEPRSIGSARHPRTSFNFVVAFVFLVNFYTVVTSFVL